MKKSGKKMVEKVVRKFAVSVVSMEVNSTCPFAVYQPKLPDSVNSLRKK